jgi:type I restriction enzyme, S subunit
MGSESPIPRPPEWPVVRLGKIATKIGSGATPLGGEASYQSRRSNFALVRSQNVFDRRFDASGLAFISDEQAKKLQGAALQADDLLLNITGDGVTFGRCCAVPAGVLPACVNQHVSIIRVDDTLADPGYVLSLLTHPASKPYIESFNAGGSRRAITKANIESFEIALPPRDEQRAIAHILGTLDDKIELNRQMNETLEAIARAIFKSWFVDFDPVRAKASGEPPESICRRLGLTPELLAFFPNRLIGSELGEIPEGWSAGALSAHIELFDALRVPLSSREREKRRGAYPYYGAASVMDFVDGYLFDGVYVLIGEDGSVANADGTPVVQYAWGKFWVNNHAHVLRAKAPMSSEQLLLLLKQTNIAPLVTGAVQAKLSQGNLKRITFVCAPDAVNEAFSDLISPLFGAVRARVEESDTLRATRDLLLPKLLSGEIRLPVESAA